MSKIKLVVELPQDWENSIASMSDSEIVGFLYGALRNGEAFKIEAIEHAKTLKEFCRDRDNLDDPCEDCPFHLYETGFGFCVLNYGLYPNEWFMPQESEDKK